MAGHTPGPWLYRPQEYDDWGVVRMSGRDEDGYQRHICQASYAASPDELSQHRKDGTDPAEANARLIAAAPELLEALEWIAANYENADINHVGFRVQAKHRADAAIAKARGD